MPFPFSIEFNENLQINSQKNHEDEVYKVLENYLNENNVSELNRTDNCLKFKAGFYKNTNNPFGGIDNGEFKILIKDGDYILRYKFYYTKIIIIVLIFCVIVSILSKNPSIGIIGFILFIFLGITLSILRQNITYYKIIQIINPDFKRKN